MVFFSDTVVIIFGNNGRYYRKIDWRKYEKIATGHGMCMRTLDRYSMCTSASNGRSPTRSMRIELAVSELEINVRRSMCELENMGIGRIGSLKQSLKPKIRCVYTKTNPCYRPANGLVPDMASILCMFSVRTPADSTDGDREFPQYIVFYRRG